MKKWRRPINQMNFSSYFWCDAPNTEKETKGTKTALTLTSVGPGLEGAAVVMAGVTAGRLVSSVAGTTLTRSTVDFPAGKA